MKKFILVISLNLLIPLFLLVVLPSVLIHVRQGTSQNSGTQLLSFIQDKPINFSFISDHPDLQSLSIDFKNPGLKNNSPITFDISGPDSQRSIVFYGSNIGDPSTVPLKFPPFTGPSLTKYTINLSTDNTDHSSLYLITDSSHQPVFRSYYQESNIKTNIFLNYQRQFDLLKDRSLPHLLIYFSLILLLDFLIIRK